MILDVTDPAIAREVLALQRVAYAVEAEIIGWDGIPGLREPLEKLMATDESFLGEYDEEGLVGAVGFTREGSTVDICRLVVHPRAFRTGVASRLLDALEPAERTTVSTGTGNEPALRLYAKRGFVPFGLKKVAPGVTITLLRKEPHRWVTHCPNG